MKFKNMKCKLEIIQTPLTTKTEGGGGDTPANEVMKNLR